MRVIAGTARHLQLKTVPGMETRPTTDRTKETLFNILHPDLPHCRFLDLFSGSGAIGIEAASRGAKEVVMIEQASGAAACIRENLIFTGMKGRLLEMSVENGLVLLEREGSPFDFIFMDPPYDKGLEKQVLAYLQSSGLVDKYTWIIVEASLNTSFSYLSDYGFQEIKRKQYKTNQHVILARETVSE